MKLSDYMKNGLAKVKYQAYAYFSLISLCYLTVFVFSFHWILKNLRFFVFFLEDLHSISSIFTEIHKFVVFKICHESIFQPNSLEWNVLKV